MNGGAGVGQPGGRQQPASGMPYRLGTRGEFLDAMLAELFAATDAQGRPFGLRTRALDDPTVALLDAWAAVADVIAFYQARIADEGFKRTAVLPESVIALANLAGKRPRPGLAASVYLAYTLSPDTADTAVSLQAGLKAQTVPGPGELPQTFETTQDLVARPSWNSLGLRMTAPLMVTKGSLPLLDQLTVTGTSAHLSANDVILLGLADGPEPGLLRVAQATADAAAGQTVVQLRVNQRDALRAAGTALSAILSETHVPPGPFQAGLASEVAALKAAEKAAGAQSFHSAIASAMERLPDWAELASARGDPATAAFARQLLTRLMNLAPAAASLAATDPQRGTPQRAARAASTDVTSAATLLSAALTAVPPTLPGPAPAPVRRAAQDFGPGLDQALRLLIGLRPALTASLYPALATTTVGKPSVGAASVLRVKAAPFGAQVAPRVVSNDPGKPPQTEEWPIGGSHVCTLTIPMDARHELSWDQLHRTLHGQTLAVEVTSPAGHGQQAIHGPGRRSDPTSLQFDGGLGSVSAGLDADSFTLSCQAEPGVLFSLTVQAGTPAGIAFRFGDNGGETWNPEAPAPLRMTAGHQRLTVAWSFPGGGTPGAAVVITVETPLPLGEAGAKVLTLDRVYDAILAGTWVVVEQTAVPPQGDSASQAPGAGEARPAAAAEGGGSQGQAAVTTVIARVLDARPATVQRYGVTARATQLRLDNPWASRDFRLLSSIRNVVVRAQPDVLTLRWPKVTADIAGGELELDRVYAGLEPGKPVIVTGTRADLPVGSSLPAAEVAIILSVRQGAHPGVRGDVPHTTLKLAAPLTYRYLRGSAAVLGNVVPAQHGETQQQVLGSGQAGQLHQTFTLATGPLLATASTTQEGSTSSLTVTVDGKPWHEVDRIDQTTPAQSYLTGSDASGHVTIMFAGRLPSGSGNVSATYRVGQGSLGNVRAHQITQLVSRPLGVTGVDNPLPAAGGADGDSPESLRASTSTGLSSLGRLVTVADYADIAASWSGVGKAAAVIAADGGQRVVHVTVASPDPAAPLDPAGGLITALRASLSDAGGPAVPLVVAPAELALIVLAAAVDHDPAVGWQVVSAALRAALLGAFGYGRRQLGQDVVCSELVAAAQAVSGVVSVTVEALTVVPAWFTPADLAGLKLAGPAPAVIRVPGARVAERTAAAEAGDTLGTFAARHGVAVSALLLANPGLNTVVLPQGTRLVLSSGLQPAQLAYLPASVPAALVLREATT